MWRHDAVHHIHAGRVRVRPNAIDGMQGAYLGPEFAQADIEKRLATMGAHFATVPHDEMLDATAKALAEGQAVGWFQGRMEFGPRALGNRSILGDPRSQTMQKNLNLKVKYRESFRPFAPSVLREEVANWFDLDVDSPYMLLVAPVAQQHMRRMTPEEEQLFGIDKLNVVRSTIPAVTHVDYSARVQTVHRDTNPTYYELISRFQRLTGYPVIINTSFNVRSEPIVCTRGRFAASWGRSWISSSWVIQSCTAGRCLAPAVYRTSSSWIEAASIGGDQSAVWRALYNRSAGQRACRKNSSCGYVEATQYAKLNHGNAVCARTANGHAAAPPEQRDEIAPFHHSSHRRRGRAVSAGR